MAISLLDLSSPDRIIEFINTHPLPPVTVPQSLLTTSSLPDDFDAAVVGSSLMSFARGLLPQQRKDLSMCNLYAQQTACMKDYAPQLDWFERYKQLLLAFGTAEAETLEVRRPAPGSGMRDEVQSVIAQAGEEYGELTRRALASLEDDRPAQVLFEQESKYSEGSQFQVLPCTGEEEGVVNIALYHREFIYEPETPWWWWGGKKAQLTGLKERLCVVPFRIDFFEGYRPHLQARVKDHIQSKIALLDIGS